jgi:putative solute:sodium symporter small subunit
MDHGAQGAGRIEGRYWRRVLRATAVLAAAWAFGAVLLPWFAPSLSGTLFGFPLGYWLSAQGALLLYLAVIVAYVVWMERLDAAHRDEAPPPAADDAPR